MDRSVLPRSINRGIDRRRLHRGAQWGLPQGLDEGWLTAIVRQERGADLKTVRYAPFQLWKVGSAFLVWVGLDDGTAWTLVFKDARFAAEDFPAASGLSLQPGIPEFSLYSNMSSGLQSFVPQTYGARELTAGQHYQYLMEDLRRHHRPLYSARDRIRVLTRVPEVHRALNDWVQEQGSDGLLVYDRAYVKDLVHHAETGLEQFASLTSQDKVSGVRAVWPDVVAYLMAESNLARRRLRPIHGDLNTKNCFVPKSEDGNVRVVDWEWAGFGTAHDDIASLVKRPDRHFESLALLLLKRLEPELSEQDHLELFQWSRIATAVRDASLLSHQLGGLEGERRTVVAARASGLWSGLMTKYAQLGDPS